MAVIISCSRSNHRFCKKIHNLSTLCAEQCMQWGTLFLFLFYQGVLPRVMTLSLRFWHTLLLDLTVCLDLKTKLPIYTCTSRSGRSRGSSTASSLQGASHCIRCFTRAGPFMLNVFSRWGGLVCNWLHWSWCPRLWSILNLVFQAHHQASHHGVPFVCFEWNLWCQAPKKKRFDRYPGHALFWTSSFIVILICNQHCRVTSFRIIEIPVYRGLEWVKTMPCSLLPLTFICCLHPWHLPILILGFSTKLHLHGLHLTRVCGLRHNPSFSNSANVSAHYLSGSNKTGCWSYFVSCVANFS